MATIDHLGIVVKDLSVSVPIFEKILNTSCHHQEFVESERVSVAFFKMANQLDIELVSSADTNSSISKFITKRGEGIHHIAFQVTDIVAEMNRLQTEGFQLINNTPINGAHDTLVCFLHPKTSNGVLIELCQKKNRV
ncbi:MAG: methylmalonyl-CoA epimerase [Phycisphaerales bacterium]|nr:methylmalonyl-CoA epimerase [Phycisphaerales bacterium]